MRFFPHNVNLKSKHLVLFGALIILTSCSVYTFPRSEPLPPDWDAPGATPVVATNINLNATNSVKTSPPPQPPIPPDTNTYEETWVGLSSWATSHGFQPVQRVHLPPLEISLTNDFRWRNLMLDGMRSIVPLPIFSADTGKGVLVLQPGTHRAHWDGTVFYFGFAPRLVQGDALLHVLDIKKNLNPLLNEPAWSAKTNRLIVIDPGCGGPDAGALSVADQSCEKQWTLDWALRLAPLLQQNGWKVLLTRTNDAGVSAVDRVALAEQSRADLFVSLHFQESANPDENGVAAYCLTPAGLSSAEDGKVEDDPTHVLPNNAFDADNLRSAMAVQHALISALPAHDLGVQRTRLADVLWNQHRPAIVIVGGYLSNTNEARLILNPLYRESLAEAVSAALK